MNIFRGIWSSRWPSLGSHDKRVAQRETGEGRPSPVGIQLTVSPYGADAVALSPVAEMMNVPAAVLPAHA
jgi:hypothetical protein